jgi:alanyl-tRNA synthetase
MALDLRNRNAKSVVGLFSTQSDRVTFVVSASADAQKSGIKAGALVKIGSQILGGGGGGKDDFAQGGGVDASKIPAAIKELKAAIGKN